MEKQIGNFLFKETSIEGVIIIEPKKYGDNRGYFMRIKRQILMPQASLMYLFKIINLNQKKVY